MPKALDLTGQKFGKLTAIKKVSSRGKKTYWLCKCECGEQKEIQTCHLTSGVVKGCGKCKNNPLLKEEEKICILCKAKFIANNIQRLYCYECSPSGLNPTDALRYKKRKVKSMLIHYKGGKCSKCGYNRCQGALQFHHLNPEEKEFTLSQVNLNDTDFSFENLQKEVDKCVLLCANCHFEEHYKDEIE